MSRVAVPDRVLRWAVDRSGLTSEDLERRIPHITDWISGLATPTLKQLETLAKVTLTPLGFFFLKEPPEERLPIPEFRTLDDETVTKPSPDLLETVHLMQQRQSWMREF